MQLKAKIVLLLLACICTGCASYTSSSSSSVMSVHDLAANSDKFDGKDVEVIGTICEGMETMGLSLQPGKKCDRDSTGIILSFEPDQLRPKLGARVTVAGHFIDNSKFDPTFVYSHTQTRLLNYPVDGYLANCTIQVKSHK